MWAVRKTLRRSGTMARLGEDHLWHSISQGVREARRTHGLKHVSAQAEPASLDEAELDEEAVDAVPAQERIAPRRSDLSGG
jgi:hypothetical protein